MENLLSLFSTRLSYKRAFRRVNPPLSALRSSLKAFTLIELLVVILIMGILGLALFIYLVPQKQLSKAKDAIRKHDAQEIKKALDLYYNDHTCYPAGINFGSLWSENGEVYMRKVPEDPDCQADGASCYRYQTDTTSTCPQWNVLYTKTETKLSEGASTGVVKCGLSLLASCSPVDIESWSCEISGKPDCATMTQTTVGALPGGANNAGSFCTGSTYVCTPGGCDVGSVGGETFCSFQECDAAYRANQC